MSEQQPQPPESNRPSPPPVSPSFKKRSSGELDQLRQVAQSFWVRAKPLLVSLGAKSLELTLQVLTLVQQQLEKETPQSSQRKPKQPVAVNPSEEPVISKPRTSRPVSSDEVAQQILNRLQDLWLIVLGLVRARLPQPLRRSLPDNVLTVLISLVLLLILWLTSAVLPDQPKVARKTPPSASTPTEVVAPPQIAAPQKEEPIAVVSPSPVIEPEPIPVIEPEPTPAPLQLTPEQKLIAQIQDQVAAVTDRYAEGLIQSVQANFKRSRLIVAVGPGWFDLDAAQQDRLAQEVLQRSQTLAFEKLELTDREGSLLARSPVVGDEVIILKRRNKPLDTL